MSSSIKNWTRYLVEKGLLFEINRKVLHPLGLALAADVDYNNRTKIKLTHLYDAESDDGFLYDDETYKENKAIFDLYMKDEGQDKLDKRKKALGFIVQGEDENK